MRVERLVFCGAAALLAAGCAERPEPVETGMAETSRDGGVALLRVVHADPGSGTLAVYRGHAEASGGLGYLESRPWVPVAAGDGRLSILRTRDPGGTAAAETDEELDAGARYTLITYSDDGHPRMRLFDDAEERDPERVRLRVINLIDDGPEVELFVRGGRDRLLDDIEPGEVEEEWVGPSERALEFRREGEREPYLLVPNFRLVAGRGYTLVLTGTGERPDVVGVGDEE